jgi:hypothetical protein
VHALFTLLLVEDGARLGLDADYWRWGQEALLDLLDAAYDMVGDRCSLSKHYAV